MYSNKLSLLIILFSIGVFAQQDTVPLTLNRSIELALENNLDLRRAELREETSEVNFKQTRANVLPTLNGRINAGINNGRSIDPYTNAYIDEQLSFSNAGLDLGAPVFNGFRLRNSIQRARYNLRAAEMETEEARQSLILDVTLAYLQILNNRDLVQLADLRIEASSQQIERLKELYELGEGNPAAYTDILGQYATDQTSLVRARNSLTESMLNLARLLNVNYEIMPEEQDLPMLPEEYSLNADAVYEDALQNMATFQARALRIKAAEEAVNVARSQYSPEIMLFAQLNTNYSSVARIFNETGTTISETGGFVTIDDQNIPVFRNETLFSPQEIGIFDQFTNNLSSVIGVAVDIPLFNGFRARNNVSLQKIQLEESKVEMENTKALFRQSIKEAHAAMEAAYSEYIALQEQVEAYAESFRINEIRFNSGVSNIVEYIISKNNLDAARVNLANAKYEYLLRVKVLEYFRGNM